MKVRHPLSMRVFYFRVAQILVATMNTVSGFKPMTRDCCMSPPISLVQTIISLWIKKKRAHAQSCTGSNMYHAEEELKRSHALELQESFFVVIQLLTDFSSIGYTSQYPTTYMIIITCNRCESGFTIHCTVTCATLIYWLLPKSHPIAGTWVVPPGVCCNRSKIC